MKKYKREEEKSGRRLPHTKNLEVVWRYSLSRLKSRWGEELRCGFNAGITAPAAMAAVGLPGSRWWEGGDYIQKRGRGKRLRIRFHLSTQYKNNKQAKRNENSLLQQKHYYRSISNCNANVSLSNPVQLR